MNTDVNNYITDDTDISAQVSTSMDESINPSVLSEETSTKAKAQEQWQHTVDRISVTLSNLPSYMTEFFIRYRRPLTLLGLILGSVILLKLLIAILNTINSVPLMQPTLELIGLAYTSWFIYRYMLQASTREELGMRFDDLKARILGEGSV